MYKLFRSISARHSLARVSIAIALLTLGAESALAHAQLIRSTPTDKAELRQAPTRVELWFNELLDDSFNSVQVIPAAQVTTEHPANLVKDRPEVDPTDRTHLIVDLSGLKPGDYVVRYRVLSRDGHSAPGQLVFRVLELKR